jgi:hypothetical protein
MEFEITYMIMGQLYKKTVVVNYLWELTSQIELLPFNEIISIVRVPVQVN